MADVPDQPVLRRVEDVMERHRQLDDAEAGAEVAAGHRDGVDGFLTKLVCDLPHLLDLELAKIVGRANGVEKRRFTKCGHSDIPILHVGANNPTRDGVRVNRAVKIQMPGATSAGRYLIESLDALWTEPCDMHHVGRF